MGTDERVYKVDLLARVEGEGRFWVEVEDGTVRQARLSIFEAPRFFEGFMRGRDLAEVPDIVARICGICPIAYQMSSARALEQALGIEITPAIRALRRLIYCGEWIESHALHVFLLHAPDFLGFDSAIEMAQVHRDVVERGLRIKRAGNAIVELLGGRAIHPVSPRVGGFYRAPSRAEVRRLVPMLRAALADAEQTVQWSARLPTPELEQDYVFVALQGADYPLEDGDALAVTGRDPVPVHEFEQVFEEEHIAESNALQCRLEDGRTYLTGPMARFAHFHPLLHPRAWAAFEATGLAAPVRNPYRSIVVRSVEIVHALAEALDIIAAYDPPDPPFVEAPPRAAEGAGATEAPRGTLWHRYRIDGEGTIEDARIVPPTSQNQARIEDDLIAMVPELLGLPHETATHRCESLIRSYDPCISCATHFLRLEIREAGGR